jgi:hypothetical protein
MGGALASMFSIENDDDERFKRLGTLVQTFREVDQEVALTRTLKEASRDLGIRGRQIQLSASMVRKMVLSGTRADAGYAATGAPPILIDAISGLLSIPLEMTREIASTFIAGDVADATHALITAIKRRTLTKLNVETAVLGASLLENVARKLISGERVELHHAQPFRNARIAFLATTTNLGKQCHEVLCDVTHYGKPFDFIQAALSSSAFPLVFAPRRASDVFPGWGRSDVRYSDGGLFDNLPFQPAIDALADVQLEESKDYDAKEIKAYVKDRFENPDLFVAGALDPCPEAAKDADGPFQHLNEIHSRASTLGNNSKIHSFRNWCNLGYKQFSALNAELERREDGIEFIEPKVVRGYVNGAVLPVFPTDAEHLNGTFAFCKSTGMKDERLVLSVADGCYQTFKAFAEADRDVSEGLKQSLSRLQGRVPKISKAESEEASAERCPFFRISEEKFQCPFAKADQKAVYQSCLDDETHHHARPGKTGVV